MPYELFEMPTVSGPVALSDPTEYVLCYQGRYLCRNPRPGDPTWNLHRMKAMGLRFSPEAAARAQLNGLVPEGAHFEEA